MIETFGYAANPWVVLGFNEKEINAATVSSLVNAFLKKSLLNNMAIYENFCLHKLKTWL